jgi:hypothetical protein
MLVYAMFFSQQIAAFIGLGLTFWGAIFALARSRKYVESRLLDSAASPGYATIDRMMNDLKFAGRAYYLPAYPQDVFLPEYLHSLKDPVVFISESFDGRPSVDELAAGRFLSSKTQGVFLASPGSGLVEQLERQLKMDFSKINLQELVTILPRSLTDIFNLAKTVDMAITPDGVTFRASGLLYESFYRPQTPQKSVSVLGCPVVSAVASALAKTSGKTVIIKDQKFLHGSFGVNVLFDFLGEST